MTILVFQKRFFKEEGQGTSTYAEATVDKRDEGPEEAPATEGGGDMEIGREGETGSKEE
jgi:hypothetical protein